MTMMFRRGLPVASALAGAAALLPGAAVAADCSTDKLSNYIAGSGCTIGDLTFSSFTYNYTNNGFGVASQYNDPKYWTVHNLGSELSFSNNGTGVYSSVVTLGFTVTAPTAELQNFALSYDGSVYHNYAFSWSIDASLSNGASASVSQTFAATPTSNGTNTKLSDSTTFSPTETLDVTLTWTTSSGGGVFVDANDAIAVNFTTPVPEPASLTLLGVGIAGLGSLKARRRARKALVD